MHNNNFQQQSLYDNVITTSKEISPGVALWKQQFPPTRPDQDLIYIFKVALNRLNILEFTADFSGSQNVILEEDPTGGLMTITVISPFQQNQVAKLIMKKDWKLKTKFKFTMKPAPKDIQFKFIQNDVNKLISETQTSLQQLRKFPISVKDIGEVIKFISDKGLRFIDPEFPPNDESVFGMDLDHTVLDTLIQWRRPSEFFTQKDANKKPEIFYERIEPSDIKQGALGDCWFLSSLSSLAERPQLVKRLFVTQNINNANVYRIKMCKNGEWLYVTIDDLFPCYPLSTPIFSSAHGNELWVLLLEKAYAKLHGSYFSLRNGFPNEALIDLTGCPTETIYFSDLKLKQNAFQTVWQKLIKYENDGYLLTGFTEGQDKWTEGLRPIEDDQADNQQQQSGLVPGHAYAILAVREARGNLLLKVRNPWGNFEWKGDWSDTSPLWTPEMRHELSPEFDQNDGTFYISYKDFLEHFAGINICKVRNWDEVRIKGKFVKVQDIEDPNIEVVMSKWYYSLDLYEKTSIVIGVHQEDERIKGVSDKRPYLDIGLTIFRRNENSNLDIVTMMHSRVERQIEIECELSPGQYIILPRTTGLNLRRPTNANQQLLQMVQQNGQLHPLVESTVTDIFRKYDMLLTRELSFVEFKGFFECLEKQLDAQFFKTSILGNYASSEKGITLKGFIDYFRDSINTLGDEAIWKWFEKLGYDRDLYSVRSRTFLLTIHSNVELSVTVRDAIQTDLDNRGHIFAVSNQDEFTQIEMIPMEHPGVRGISFYNRWADTFTIVSINDLTYPVELTIDCSNASGAVFSTKNGSVRKRIEPGQMEFMMHLKPDSNSKQKFKLDFQCGWVPI